MKQYLLLFFFYLSIFIIPVEGTIIEKLTITEYPEKVKLFFAKQQQKNISLGVRLIDNLTLSESASIGENFYFKASESTHQLNAKAKVSPKVKKHFKVKISVHYAELDFIARSNTQVTNIIRQSLTVNPTYAIYSKIGIWSPGLLFSAESLEYTDKASNTSFKTKKDTTYGPSLMWQYADFESNVNLQWGKSEIKNLNLASGKNLDLEFDNFRWSVGVLKTILRLKRSDQNHSFACGLGYSKETIQMPIAWTSNNADSLENRDEISFLMRYRYALKSNTLRIRSGDLNLKINRNISIGLSLAF